MPGLLRCPGARPARRGHTTPVTADPLAAGAPPSSRKIDPRRISPLPPFPSPWIFRCTRSLRVTDKTQPMSLPCPQPAPSQPPCPGPPTRTAARPAIRRSAISCCRKSRGAPPDRRLCARQTAREQSRTVNSLTIWHGGRSPSQDWPRRRSSQRPVVVILGSPKGLNVSTPPARRVRHNGAATSSRPKLSQPLRQPVRRKRTSGPAQHQEAVTRLPRKGWSPKIPPPLHRPAAVGNMA